VRVLGVDASDMLDVESPLPVLALEKLARGWRGAAAVDLRLVSPRTRRDRQGGRCGVGPKEELGVTVD